MSDVDSISLVYAGILTTGGLIGYFRAGSVPSLVAGAGCGVLVGFATHNDIAQKTAVVTAVSAVMTILIGKRFVHTGKMAPTGIIAASSAITLVAQLYKIYHRGW